MDATGPLPSERGISTLSFDSRASRERIQQDVSALVPLAASPTSALLTDFTFQFRDEGNHSFSGGIVMRRYLPEMDAVLGFHLHGDVTESIYDHRIAQLGFGFDLFTASGLDFHGNFYLPDTGPHLIQETSRFGPAFGRGNSILQTESIFGISERGLRGSEIKVAFDFPVLNGLLPTRGHVGAYHFNGRSNDDLAGMSAGVLVQPFEGVSVGAEYYGDDEFYGDHWVFFAGVSTTFESGSCFHPRNWRQGIRDAFRPRGAGSRERERMEDFLFAPADRRNWVLTEFSDPFLTETKLNEVLADVIFVNNGGARSVPGPRGNGRGTFANPVNTIQRGINRSAARFGNSGNIVVAGSKRPYTEDLVDAGRSVRLHGGRVPALAGRTFRYGSRPTIDGGIMVTHVDTFSISNFQVVNGAASFVNPDAIFAGNVTNVSVIGNRVINSAQDGIDIEGTRGPEMTAVVRGNLVRNSSDDGIDFDLEGGSRAMVAVEGNRILNPLDDGIEFDIEDNARVYGTVSRNRVRASIFGEGIEIDQDDNSIARLRILDNNLRSVFNDPIDIDVTENSRGTYQVAGNRFDGLFPATRVEIDSDDTSLLRLQFVNNSTTSDLQFVEFLTSTFLLERQIGSNALLEGSVFHLDNNIRPLRPFGSFGFPAP